MFFIIQKTFRRTFRYEFFGRTHPRSLTANPSKHGFSQKFDFSTFSSGMSSSKYEFLHVKTHGFGLNWHPSNHSNHPMMIYGLWKKSWKIGFSEKKFSRVKIWTFEKKNFVENNGYNVVSRGLKWSYLLPKLFCGLTWTSSSISTNFSENCQKVDFDVRPSLDWSTVGQHLLTSKIPQLKSSKSGDYFSCIGLLHISKR